MGCNSIQFVDMLIKFGHRQTLPKKEFLRTVVSLMEGCKALEHYPACNLPGQKPSRLSEEHEKENVIIRKLNKDIDAEIKRVKDQIKVYGTR